MAAPGVTRQLLVEAALREFATHGIENASLLEITRVAGQRNRGAVHYHFGSRHGLLIAVLESEADFLAVREHELLERARDDDHGHPHGPLAAAIEAVIRPAVELSETGWRGRCYLMVVAEILDGTSMLDPEVTQALARTGGADVYELIRERMPLLPEDLYDERLALATAFLLRSIAGRARFTETSAPRRPQLPTERFVANLVLMTAQMLAAPDL